MGLRKEEKMKILTFEKICRECLEKKRPFIKESTYLLYECHLNNHIVPALGHMRCSEITEEMLQDTVVYWATRGHKNKMRGLVDKTLRDIVMLLKLCINYSKKKGYIKQFSYEIVFPTKRQPVRIKTFNIEEQQKIIQAVKRKKDSKTNGILLCLYTGIRIGELCALKWSDIDFEREVVSISKTIQRLYFNNEKGKGTTKITITSPKTMSSIREIPLSSGLSALLKDYRPKNCNTYLLTCCEKYIEPRTYRNYYIKFLKNNCIRELSFHCLRHTFATRCIEFGADYKTVSELLGHSCVNTTLNLYVHPGIEQKRKCIELVNSIF